MFLCKTTHLKQIKIKSHKHKRIKSDKHKGT